MVFLRCPNSSTEKSITFFTTLKVLNWKIICKIFPRRGKIVV